MTDARFRGDLESVCTGAVRTLPSDANMVVVVSRKGDELKAQVEQWSLAEEHGATFLETRVDPLSGGVYRKIPTPPELTRDPCEDEVPILGL